MLFVENNIEEIKEVLSQLLFLWIEIIDTHKVIV
jgi:hypothetical protein